MAQWFYGSEVGHARATVDLRPGGEYVIEMFNEQGERDQPHGAFLEIVRPERLVFTWSVEGFVKDTRVTIELFERAGGTELMLTHELPQDTIEPHRKGWTTCLGHLEALLSSEARG